MGRGRRPAEDEDEEQWSTCFHKIDGVGWQGTVVFFFSKILKYIRVCIVAKKMTSFSWLRPAFQVEDVTYCYEAAERSEAHSQKLALYLAFVTLPQPRLCKQRQQLWRFIGEFPETIETRVPFFYSRHLLCILLLCFHPLLHLPFFLHYIDIMHLSYYYSCFLSLSLL